MDSGFIERFAEKARLAQARADADAREKAEQARMGEARRLARWCATEGYVLSLTDTGLRCSPRPPDDVAAALKAAKPELIALLRERDPEARS